jgi:hypothetical protein
MTKDFPEKRLRISLSHIRKSLRLLCVVVMRTFIVVNVANVLLALFVANAVADPNNHQDKHVLLNSQTPYFSQSMTTHFTLIHDLQPARAQKLTELLEETYTRFFNFFEETGFNPSVLDQRLNWLCFSNLDSFNSYISRTENMNLSWLSSYYSAKTNSVAILLTLGQETHPQNNVACDTNSAGNIMAASNNDYDRVSDILRIGHELAHQLAFNTGLQKRKVMYPIWVSEGLATAFEMQLNCRGLGCRKLTNTLDNIIPLNEFIPMTRLPADSKLHPYVYAQAQALFNFLMAYHGEQLRTYLKNLHNLEPGWRSADAMLTEFIDVFGPLGEFEKEWIQHVSTSVANASASR